MKMRDGGSIIFCLVILAIVAGLGASWVTKQDDTLVEEVAEEVIKTHTGVDVDLTPESKEER